MKDLEQPLSISFSSSKQFGGAKEETGRSVKEEGKDELEEEDAELNPPSPPLTFINPFPSSLTVSPLFSPPQASSPAPRPRSASTPGSGSMTWICSVPVRSCLVTFLAG